MENNSLANLKDLQLPEAVSIFPLAPGWYGVIAILVLIMFAIGYWQIRRLHKLQRVSNIITLLDSIALQNNPQLLAEVSILLKRVAREKFPEQQPQSLFGDKWLQFLDKSGKTTNFTQGAGSILLDVYQNKPLENPEKLITIIKTWLKVVL